jgi:predicted RNase H-like HicB family nuclease
MPGKVSTIIEEDGGGFFAHCPGLPGCHSQGDTLEEALANIREAAELYIEVLDEGEEYDLT